MAQETTVTIETAFQIDLEVPNRMKRNVTLEKAAQYILILAALQTVSIFGCARQSAEVHTLKPEEIPETIVFENFEVEKEVIGELIFANISWTSSYPSSTSWRYGIVGGSYGLAHDRWGEIPLRIDHYAQILATWDTEVQYKLLVGGFDINYDYHGGVGQIFIWDGTNFSFVEE